MPQALKTAIYTKLTADTSAGSLHESVGGRIYEAEGADDVALPLLVYEVTTASSGLTMADDELIDAVVTFTIWNHKASGMASLGSIEGKLYTLMQSADMTMTGYDRGNVTATSRDVRMIIEDVVSSQSVYRVQATAF